MVLQKKYLNNYIMTGELKQEMFCYCYPLLIIIHTTLIYCRQF